MLFANQRKAKENKGEEMLTELNLTPVNYSKCLVDNADIGSLKFKWKDQKLVTCVYT